MSKNTYKILRNKLFNIILKQPFTNLETFPNTFKGEFLVAYPIYNNIDFKYGMVLLRGHTFKKYYDITKVLHITIINNNRMYFNNIIDYNKGEENLYLDTIYPTDRAYIGPDDSFNYSNETFKLILNSKILKIYDFLVNYNISHNKIFNN